MRYLLHIRSDALQKPGGDVALAKTFSALLIEEGHQTIVSSSLPEVPIDGVITFNIDRPYEAACLIADCRILDIPVLIYSLHHPVVGLRQYLRSGTTGIRRVLAALSWWNPDRYETLLNLTKFLGGLVKVHRPGNFRFLFASIARKYVLGNVKSVLVSCPEEAEQIRLAFGYPIEKMVLVPHVVAADTSVADSCLVTPIREYDFVCAGRIEARKNQLAVLQLASNNPDRSFIFAGAASPTEAGYFAKFKKEISVLPNVKYVGGLSLMDLRMLLRKSKIFVSMSWFEVISLTEIEAIRAGCHLMIGPSSYIPRYCDQDSLWPLTFDPISEDLKRLLKVGEFQKSGQNPNLSELEPSRVRQSLKLAISAIGFRS